jgi:hypothetical protein
MAIHFEDLWEKCEKFHQAEGNEGSAASLIDELMMKLNLYKVIDLKPEIPEEDRQKIKSRTLGEILLTLTQLSLKDNINVFEALSVALQYRTIETYSEKYKS